MDGEQEKGPRVWGSTVDDVISESLFGPNGEPTGEGLPFNHAGNDPVKSTVAAMTIIERHIVPVRSEDMGALALLQIEADGLGPDGEIFRQVAAFWQANHHLRGSAGPLLQGLESASAMRQFKGTTGTLVRGMGPGGPGGGGRR